jgi:hypothetical protein
MKIRRYWRIEFKNDRWLTISWGIVLLKILRISSSRIHLCPDEPAQQGTTEGFEEPDVHTSRTEHVETQQAPSRTQKHIWTNLWVPCPFSPWISGPDRVAGTHPWRSLALDPLDPKAEVRFAVSLVLCSLLTGILSYPWWWWWMCLRLPAERKMHKRSSV